MQGFSLFAYIGAAALLFIVSLWILKKDSRRQKSVLNCFLLNAGISFLLTLIALLGCEWLGSVAITLLGFGLIWSKTFSKKRDDRGGGDNDESGDSPNPPNSGHGERWKPVNRFAQVGSTTWSPTDN